MAAIGAIGRNHHLPAIAANGRFRRSPVGGGRFGYRRGLPHSRHCRAVTVPPLGRVKAEIRVSQKYRRAIGNFDISEAAALSQIPYREVAQGGAGMRLIASAAVCAVPIAAIAGAGTLADCGTAAVMSDGWPVSPPA